MEASGCRAVALPAAAARRGGEKGREGETHTGGSHREREASDLSQRKVRNCNPPSALHAQAEDSVLSFGAGGEGKAGGQGGGQAGTRQEGKELATGETRDRRARRTGGR